MLFVKRKAFFPGISGKAKAALRHRTFRDAGRQNQNSFARLFLLIPPFTRGILSLYAAGPEIGMQNIGKPGRLLRRQLAKRIVKLGFHCVRRNAE